MERRLLLAIALMIAVVVAVNLLFPPALQPPSEAERDTVAVEEPAGERPPAEAPGRTEPPESPAAEDAAAPGDAAPLALPGAEDTAGAGPGEAPADAPAADVPAQEAARDTALRLGETAAPTDTIVVRSPIWEYRFADRGATLIGASLLRYRSYGPGAEEEDPVELVRPGDLLLGYRLAVGADTVDLRGRRFEPSAPALEVPEEGADSVSFAYRIPTANPDIELRLVLVYRFRADRYVIEVEGRLEGLGPRGYAILTSLGRGLASNEANPDEDFGQLAYVTRGRDGSIRSERLDEVAAGDRRAAEGAPFGWVAIKNKYFLAALISPPGSPGFGGLLVEGHPEEHAAELEAALPVPAGQALFRFDAFLGPQDYGRLTAIGQDLENVNPYGWRWLRPIIRPLVGLIMVVLVWMHETFDLAYGWVLILFGVLMRVVLFPLYQKSMRAQMAQMQVQPLIKEMQKKYKDEPQKMQQEMIRLYKEHNINPLAGCLPMLLPFPVLITLFFVFQNTIEFRGVPFLWLPDLSLKDPIYVIPLLMGLSMFLLQWIGQRGMESNQQMKMMMWAMPVVFTVIFVNFPSGLNLYYATSNFASLPQQLYLSKERRKAYAKRKTPGDSDEEEGGG